MKLWDKLTDTFHDAVAWLRGEPWGYVSLGGGKYVTRKFANNLRDQVRDAEKYPERCIRIDHLSREERNRVLFELSERNKAGKPGRG